MVKEAGGNQRSRLSRAKIISRTMLASWEAFQDPSSFSSACLGSFPRKRNANLCAQFRDSDGAPSASEREWSQWASLGGWCTGVWVSLLALLAIRWCAEPNLLFLPGCFPVLPSPGQPGAKHGGTGIPSVSTSSLEMVVCCVSLSITVVGPMNNRVRGKLSRSHDCL